MKWLSALRRAALVAALFVCGAGTVDAQTYPGTQQPWFLTADITVFVDGSAGNDNNSGMAAGAGNAWATFAPAYNFLCNRTNGNGHAATIQVANASSIVGAGGIGGAFALKCAPQNYAFVILNLGAGTLTPASGFDAVLLMNGPQGNGFTFPGLHITNGTITCSGGGAGVHVIAGSAIVESFGGGTLTFGTCTGGSHIFADGNLARIFINTGYTISGNASNHWTALAGGGIDFNTAATITCTGSPAFTAFAAASTGPGWIYAPSGTISFSGCGTVTGARYQAANNGSIITNNGGPNFFPGNAAGSVSTSGSYDSQGTPSVSACGTTPGSPTGSDRNGNVTEGTTATGCTLTFASANAPKSCSVNSSNATVQAGLVISTLNATTLTVTHPSASGAVFYWNCPPN